MLLCRLLLPFVVNKSLQIIAEHRYIISDIAVLQSGDRVSTATCKVTISPSLQMHN